MIIKVKFSEKSKLLEPNFTENPQSIETDLGDYVIIRGDDGITPHIGENGNWWLGNKDTGVKAKGEDGKSVSIESITESTASGGGNVVKFSDGKTMTVMNGNDYILTPADKEEIVESVKDELPDVSPVKSVNGKTGNITLNADDVGADAKGSVSNHNVNTGAHNDIRLELTRLGGIINDILDSDDPTLDEMHEVVAIIKSNKELIEAITIAKVNVADIIDNLDTNVSDRPLSAAQGVALKQQISNVETHIKEYINETLLGGEW